MLTCSVASRYVGSQPVDGMVRPAVPSMPRLLYVKLQKHEPRKRGAATGGSTMDQRCTIWATFLSALIFPVASAWADPPKLPVPAFDQSAVAQRGYFYVGGKYIGEPGKNIMQRPGLRRGARAEGRASAVSAGAHPWRGADPDQLDGHAGWAQGLGRLFRRAGLRRLHDRPADARPLRMASSRRRNAHVQPHEEERLFTDNARSGKPGRRPRSTRNGRAKVRQGQEGRSGLRRVLRHAGRRPSISHEETQNAIRTPARRCSTRSGRRS